MFGVNEQFDMMVNIKDASIASCEQFQQANLWIPVGDTKADRIVTKFFMQEFSGIVIDSEA